MSVPNPQFTPDPTRAIQVQGLIDQQLLYRLTPQIIDLQSQSNAPITVYIDSPGGVTAHMDSLLQLLRVHPYSDQQGYFITVVTSQAASAAADLLATGNYAWAYPNSAILYHGVRVPGDKILTVEETLQLAQRLKAGNESYAMQLAREADFRALFRFIMLRDQFTDVRTGAQNSTLSDLACYTSILTDKLSTSAADVLDKAKERHGRYNKLLAYVAMRTKLPSQYSSLARAEAAQIKAIVSFELSQHRGTKHQDWRFLEDGMNRVADDFFLIHEYIRMFRGPQFRRLCATFADFLLTDKDREEIGKLPEQEQPERIGDRVRPILSPIWSFFVALCYELQRGENQLSGRDAFWLGLIDDVVGVGGLPSYRVFELHSQELAEDEKAKQEQDEVGQRSADAAGA